MNGNLGKRHWEGVEPPLTIPSKSLQNKIRDIYENKMASLMAHPFLSADEIHDRQMKRISDVLKTAYQKTDFYRKWLPFEIIEKDFQVNYQEFCKIKPIYKHNFISSNHSYNNKFIDETQFYETRSSGSSGETLDILIDEFAVAIDTVQGIRQILMQSGLKLSDNCSVVQICTVPWFIDNVDGKFINNFISSLIPIEKITDLIIEMRCDVISVYPSLISEISKIWKSNNDYNPKLIIVHSEQSTQQERDYIQNIFKCPVFDEYSSEEATRIALQMPCGHYHTCDDTVFVEILHPETLMPQVPGKIGIVAVTNLINTCMPFIRYIQGDWASFDPKHDCSINWRTIKSIDGREGDFFIGKNGKLIPSGTLLDICYRTMYDCGISFPKYELVQVSLDVIDFRYQENTTIEWSRIINYLHKKIQDVLGHEITLNVKKITPPLNDTNNAYKKRRPIRREMD